MILYVSDFDLSGSGYMHIGTNLCNELVTRHDIGVVAIGMGYDGREHHWPYSIAPCSHLQQVPHMVTQIRNYGAPVEAVVVALDIPLQEALMKALHVPGDLPYVGIFPLEAGPLCMPWAMELSKMSARLVMSRFGQAELARMGIESTFIPFGVHDPRMWRPPYPEERAQIRQGLGWDDDTFVVTTVADNQERKNLAGAMDIIAGLSVEVLERNEAGYAVKKEIKRKVRWNLVTRMDSPVGWKLEDMAMRRGVMDSAAFYNRGVPSKMLWSLFAGADAFLLTSKAEGLAIPVMEAMATRLPVVATNCTAMAEHLGDGRGLLIDYELLHTDSTGVGCSYIDPFGNGRRYLVDVEDGIRQLERLADQGPQEDALDRAEAYVRERTWQRAGDILAETIKRVGNGKAEEAQAVQIPEAASAVA